MLRPQLNLTSLPELESIVARNERPTSAQVQEFKAHAEALFKTDDPAMGWVVLLGLSASQWEFDEVHAVITRALSAVGNHPQLLANIAVTLEYLELLEEAVTYAERAHRADPMDVEWLSCFTVQLSNLGHVSRAGEVFKAYLQRNNDARVRAMLEENEAVRVGLESAGVSEGRLAQELGIARAVLRKNQVRAVSYEIGPDLDHETGETSVVALLRFAGTLEDEMRLGAELSAKFADLPHWNPCKLNVDYEYIEPADAHVAA